jgi:hypothetical protein
MVQLPLLFRFLNTAVLNQAAVIIVIKGLQGLLHGGIRQKDSLAVRPIVPAVPLADHDCIERVGLKVAAIGVTPMLSRAILVIGGQAARASATRPRALLSQHQRAPTPSPRRSL